MSGHSKWATIKRQKGVADIKRGMAFTKLSNAITIAVKRGGGITDINNNFRLRLAVEQAKTHNMPKENIERAIQKAIGVGEKEVQEVVYEGFAPEGVSVIIEAASDNPQRTTSEIKSIFNKEGGSFGQPGSVSYQFEQKGEIVVERGDKSVNELLEMVLDTQVEDIDEEDNKIILTTSPSLLSEVRKSLLNKGLKIISDQITRKPITFVSIDNKEKKDRIKNFLKRIENLDDVQKIYSNIKES